MDKEKYTKQMVHKCRLLGIEIPAWVPKHLVVEYADCAMSYGEEQAASYVRKLKREGELSELNRLVSRA